MEPTEMKLKGPSETGSEEIVHHHPRPVMVEVEQQRGIKRSRRDRGSSAKERISKMPACVPGKRSSIYRGVTRHRWTGRFEAHLWDKSTWNEAQNKKGKQVYLGAYDDEEAAARAYDLAALKYWGPGTLINFPVTDYARDVEEMQSVSREEYLASLRRKGSGFSRGSSKFKAGGSRNQMGRWESRIGQVLGNKYLYLAGSTPNSIMTQEEAAVAYDMAALEYRGLNAVTNLDLSRYIRWLRPERINTTTAAAAAAAGSNTTAIVTAIVTATAVATPNLPKEEEGDASPGKSWDEGPNSLQDDHLSPPEAPQQPHQCWPGQASEPYQLPSLGVLHSNPHKNMSSSAPTALSLVLSSSIFKSMRERSTSSLAHVQATEVDTNYNSSLDQVGGPSMGLHEAGSSQDGRHNLYDEATGNPEMFSPHIHHDLGFPSSFDPPERLVDEGAGRMTSVADSQGVSYWDPFAQPLPSQQLTSCGV